MDHNSTQHRINFQKQFHFIDLEQQQNSTFKPTSEVGIHTSIALNGRLVHLRHERLLCRSCAFFLSAPLSFCLFPFLLCDIHLLPFKTNPCAQLFQFVHRVQQRLRISDETENGLNQSQVDLSRAAFLQHPLNFWAHLLCTAQTKIYLVALHNTMLQIAKVPESPCSTGFSGAFA